MLENAKRHVILVLLVLLGAAACLYFMGVRLGTDLSGGTELIYELDKEEAPTKQEDLDKLMAQTVGIIQDRLDPDGTKNIGVSRRGREGVYIELPGMTAAEARAAERKITQLGRLETRIVAESSYNENGISFNLRQEQDRLKAWLDKDGNREMVRQDPNTIRVFNRLSKGEKGEGTLSPKLDWFYRKLGKALLPGKDGKPQWADRYAGGQSEFSQALVALYTQQDLAQEPEDDQFLVELFPVNMAELHFSGEDLDGSKVKAGHDQDGGPAVHYVVRGERQSEYADWTEKHIGHHSAIILDNQVRSAPVFISRIPGRGQITGLTEKEAEALADVLKRGSLKVHLKQQSKVTIGPTLGQRAIDLGRWSILIGAAFVLLFTLLYYRKAGIIACVSMLLNVALVFGALSLIRATLTLPGLAGLVLTIGMAIDANILIYERIREETKKGKDLLQAVRHGFEKAIVTILDANITTFLAGIVLYFVGVGPVRGFAVTMMVGILTSLFTAFFVTRLLFHYMVGDGQNRSLGMMEWFTSLRFNFLRYSKIAIACSLIIIVSGLVLFFSTKPGDKYGMDFTGGIAARVMTANAHTAEEIKKALATNEQAIKTFPTQTVNTAGDTIDGNKAKTFVIKLKVADATATDKEKGANALAKKYETTLQNALKGFLAPAAFSNIALEAGLGGKDDRTLVAELDINFGEAVSVADLKQVFANRGVSGDALTIESPKGAAPESKHQRFRVGFDVSADDLNVGDNQLTAGRIELLKPALADYTRNLLKTNDEDPVTLPDLSEPIPDLNEIGGRMVGELRNSAIGAMVIAMFLIVMFIRIRFHEYKFGIAAVAALLHDVLITLGVVVLFNKLGWVTAEIDLAMIAAFLTIIGYSINDTIVIFDRVRENVNEQLRVGDTSHTFADTLNLSINQTLSRTILTSTTTMIVVLSQFFVNHGSDSALEGLSFALIIGVLTGTYSTIFIASPVVMWLRNREKPGSGDISTIHVEPVEDPTVAPATATPG